MSAGAYIESERRSEYRREYVGGFAYPLHGDTPENYGTSAEHGRIAGNLMCLTPEARASGCNVYTSMFKL